MRDFYNKKLATGNIESQKQYLLLGNHNLEAIKVSQVAADGTLGDLLSGTSGSPLGINARGLPSLLDGGGASTTGNGNGKLGQADTADADNLALNTSARSINDNLKVRG